MYTVITTCPPYGSRNVGDKLIEQRLKELVTAEKGDADFLTVFREEPLDAYLEQINGSRAVLLAGFPVRDTPMYPGTYRLVEDLSRIRVPLIPVGANWNVYPGDRQSRLGVKYSDETVSLLRYIADRVETVSCREYYTCEVLARHGIGNTVMTGDPAWYLLSAMGRPMHRPRRVERVVFSPPLSPFYLEQAQQVMRMLARLFPEAERCCAFHLLDAVSGGDSSGKSERSAAMHPDVTTKNQAIRASAKELGFEVREMAGDLRRLDYYESCDLHVGYECHAHLNFLSRRRPSVLIAEDARGVGFNYTLGVGGFTGFVRAQEQAAVTRKAITSGYCTSLAELALAPPSTTVHLAIEAFLAEELGSGFRRYAGLGPYLDDLYETCMKPFIRSLP